MSYDNFTSIPVLIIIGILAKVEKPIIISTTKIIIAVSAPCHLRPLSARGLPGGMAADPMQLGPAGARHPKP